MSTFAIFCGGTGGHLSPGIALAEGLAARGHRAVLFVSTKKVDTKLLEKYEQISFERLPGSGFAAGPAGLARFVATQSVGTFRCVSLMRSLKPDLIVGFGGFTSAPAVLAGRLLRVPIALHECNRVPGRAIRMLGRFARRLYLPPGIGVGGVPRSAVRNVGLPVRKEIARIEPEKARLALGLNPVQKVLAILGGSQGAQPLNDWARANLEALAAEGVQVCCVTGMGKGEPEERLLRSKSGELAMAMFMPFCDRMGDLLSASDLVVSRAGAGTLAELMRCEAPAILVPFPQAADDHQRANARFFERQGGGLVVEQAMMGSLMPEVIEALFNDALLRKFRGNLRRMESANSLELIVGDLEDLAGAGPAARPWNGPRSGSAPSGAAAP